MATADAPLRRERHLGRSGHRVSGTHRSRPVSRPAAGPCGLPLSADDNVAWDAPRPSSPAGHQRQLQRGRHCRDTRAQSAAQSANRASFFPSGCTMRTATATSAPLVACSPVERLGGQANTRRRPRGRVDPKSPPPSRPAWPPASTRGRRYSGPSGHWPTLQLVPSPPRPPRGVHVLFLRRQSPRAAAPSPAHGRSPHPARRSLCGATAPLPPRSATTARRLQRRDARRRFASRRRRCAWRGGAPGVGQPKAHPRGSTNGGAAVKDAHAADGKPKRRHVGGGTACGDRDDRPPPCPTQATQLAARSPPAPRGATRHRHRDGQPMAPAAAPADCQPSRPPAAGAPPRPCAPTTPPRRRRAPHAAGGHHAAAATRPRPHRAGRVPPPPGRGSPRHVHAPRRPFPPPRGPAAPRSPPAAATPPRPADGPPWRPVTSGRRAAAGASPPPPRWEGGRGGSTRAAPRRAARRIAAPSTAGGRASAPPVEGAAMAAAAAAASRRPVGAWGG